METSAKPPQSQLKEVKLAYGQENSGLLKHISEVSSGIECGCICPECKSPLSAHKGKLLQHHFQHHSLVKCENAPETALHKMAKQIIKEKGIIWIPEFSETIDGERFDYINGRQPISFTNCTIEENQVAVIPDVVVRVAKRTLLIEIFVTHKCDDEKIAKLRRLGNSAFEIDLSGTPRDTVPQELENLVIEKAHRIWLFNERAEQKRKHFEDKRSKEKKEQVSLFNAMIAKLVTAYNRPISLETTTKQSVARFSLEAELKNSLNQNLFASPCFNVPTNVWQNTIIELVSNLPENSEGIESKTFRNELTKRGLVKPEFKWLGIDSIKALENKIPDFQTPFRNLTSFLDSLVKDGLLKKRDSKFYSVSFSIRERTTQRKKDHQDAKDIAAKIVGKFNLIATQFDTADSMSFKFEEFEKSLLSNYNGSLTEAIFEKISEVKHLLDKLEKIEQMIFDKGPICSDLVGLPIVEAVERCKLRIDKIKAENELEILNAKAVEKDRRAKIISDEAHEGLEDAETWLNSENEGSQSPKETSRISEAGLEQARTSLGREVKKRKQIEDQLNEEEGFRQQLGTYAENKITDPIKVKTFLNSKYPFCHGQKVSEYCVGAKQLGLCKEQVDRIAKDTRPHRR